MKKTITFEKQLVFKTNLNEITSIALENTLKCEDNTVEGDLIINGTYKIIETSPNVENFEFTIPINIEIDNRYITKEIQIDISNFYYEVLNNNMLKVNIEILLDNLIERLEENKIQKETLPIQEERCIEEPDEIIEQPIKNEEQTKIETKEIDIFKMIEDQEEYATYHVYIIRKEDTLETIINKYNISKEKLSEYNNINEIKLGDKIIIPTQNA
jgi:hypothetical protein